MSYSKEANAIFSLYDVLDSDRNVGICRRAEAEEREVRGLQYRGDYVIQGRSMRSGGSQKKANANTVGNIFAGRGFDLHGLSLG